MQCLLTSILEASNGQNSLMNIRRIGFVNVLVELFQQSGDEKSLCSVPKSLGRQRINHEPYPSVEQLSEEQARTQLNRTGSSTTITSGLLPSTSSY